MSEARDRLEEGLDRLARTSAERVPAPPAAFLAAVGRRRVRRRVRRALIGAGALVVAGAGVIFLVRVPGSVPPGPRRVFAESAPVTTGWYQERVTISAPESAPSGDGAVMPVVRASDWRSEVKLAALIGRS